MTKQPQDITSRRTLIRGVSWDFHEPSWIRAASLYPIPPTNRNDNVGFRCALPHRQSLTQGHTS